MKTLNLKAIASAFAALALGSVALPPGDILRVD